MSLTLRSHTHLQAAQISAQPKLTNKYACPTHTDRQKSTGYNSTYPKVAQTWFNEHLCSKQTLVRIESLVFQNATFG